MDTMLDKMAFPTHYAVERCPRNSASDLLETYADSADAKNRLVSLLLEELHAAAIEFNATLKYDAGLGVWYGYQQWPLTVAREYARLIQDLESNDNSEWLGIDALGREWALFVLERVC